MSKKEQEEKDKKHVHEELDGFDVRISPFGQIETSYDIDKINKFLNDRVDDKKLRNSSEEPLDSDSEE